MPNTRLCTSCNNILPANGARKKPHGDMSCKATDGGADTHLEDEGDRTARVSIRGNQAFGRSYKLEGATS